MTDAAPRLQLEGATKRFGAVTALSDGSIELFGGEAHALLGENGAGKRSRRGERRAQRTPDAARRRPDPRLPS